jgi:hypothetical protein
MSAHAVSARYRKCAPLPSCRTKWLPDPTCRRPFAHGRADGVVVTDTLSNVAVANRVESWLLTAKPTRTVDGIEKVALPTTVHALPSDEIDAVTT